MTPDKIKIYGRNVWNARPPRNPPTTLALPTPELWLHHSAGAQDAGANERWADDVKSIQNFHLDGRRWNDIAYNFLTDQSGQKWTGRGAGIRGAHAAGHNHTSHGICAIGNYEIHEPTPEHLEALANLVAHGLLEGWWSTAITGPHSDVSATKCCGQHLRRQIPWINRRAAELIAALTEPPPPTPLTLEERVTALEARVANLEGD